MDIVDDLRTVARSEDTGARWISGIAERGAAEIERLRAALKPFADCKRGLILNPSVEDWCRARDALDNDEQGAPK